MSADSVWDVVIVGAGAAGLLAAASAAERGRRTLLLEKNRKLGVKILMSGGTRCNITHQCSVRELAKAFGRRGQFLMSPLAALPPEKVLQKIHSEGVQTKVESTGKIFPVSDRAIDVRDALVRLAQKAGAKIQRESAVLSCRNEGGSFEVETEEERFLCRSLIITTGGRSYPGCGTTGDGYAWARGFGHSITELGPALTPVVSQVEWANQLKGISVDTIGTQVMNLSGESLASSDKSVLFTHFGFSGPGPMNVSREISLQSTEKLSLVLDFYSNWKLERLIADWEKRRSGQGTTLLQLLEVEWPKRLRESLLGHYRFDPKQRLAETSKKQLRSLAESMKQVRFPVHGTRGYAKAEVTAGGVSLDEVNSSTMQSKIQEGLFFAGEILDLDGPIGGFNFQAAFSTGWLAGQNA